MDEIGNWVESLEIMGQIKANKESINTKEEYVKLIDKLKELLLESDVPFIERNIFDGRQLIFPWCRGDVVCHSGSYGSNRGFVESYMFPWDDDDVSVYVPEDMADKIIKFYDRIAGYQWE